MCERYIYIYIYIYKYIYILDGGRASKRRDKRGDVDGVRAQFPSKVIGAPHQCSRVSGKRSGWGELSLASNASAKINRRVAVDDPFRFEGVAVVLRVPAVVRVARTFEQGRVVGAGGRDASAIPIYDDVINIAHVSIH